MSSASRSARLIKIPRVRNTRHCAFSEHERIVLFGILYLTAITLALPWVLISVSKSNAKEAERDIFSPLELKRPLSRRFKLIRRGYPSRYAARPEDGTKPIRRR